LPANAEETIRWAVESFDRGFAVLTSLQREGMVIVDMALRIDPAVRVLTIDTGRLPKASAEMIALVEAHYGIRIERLMPQPAEVAAMVQLYGEDLFRDSVAKRRLCCEVRKVRPLDRALPDLKAYAVGLRRSQAESRAGVQEVEIVNGVYKLSPLASWSADDVREYVKSHGVPEHPLYAAGYGTIGCDPCTRAIQAGDDERAGRWWWETGADKECGLHYAAAGTVMREVDVLIEELRAATHA
jgi:phosphoadenylyl-sulfate reductase (thioredoxin)